MTTDDRGVTVHRTARPLVAGRPGAPRHGARRLPAPRRLLVQYTPNAWGYKGLNFGFCRWLVRRRRRGDDVRVMFHEVRYSLAGSATGRPAGCSPPASAGWRGRSCRPLRWCTSPRPHWERLLRGYEPGAAAARSSGCPCRATSRRRRPRRPWPRPRRRIAPGGETVVGSFGTFTGRGMVAGLLDDALAPLARATVPTGVGLLIGRGGDRLAARLVARTSRLGRPAGRRRGACRRPRSRCTCRRATCSSSPTPTASHPPRTSLMAAPGARRRDGVEPRAASPSRSGTRPAAWRWRRRAIPRRWSRPPRRCSTDPEARARLGAPARQVYAARFAWERTVEALLAPSRSPDEAVAIPRSPIEHGNYTWSAATS